MNFFPLSLTMRPLKLVCLYLAITFQSSLTFAGNTRSLPKKEASVRHYNWVGSGLALKFYGQTGKGFKDKPSSLLGLVVSGEGKKFYNIDTRLFLLPSSSRCAADTSTSTRCRCHKTFVLQPK
jgi:hypothetical protein